MVVYVELVFVENFIVDYFLLKAVGFFLCLRQRHIIWASALGGVYSCLAPLSEVCSFFIVQAGVLAAMLLICFGKTSLKESIQQSIYALMCSCALYGTISTITLSGSKLFKATDKILYSDNAVFVLMCFSAFLAVVLFYISKFLLKRRRLKQVSATLILNDRKINAVIDSGNSLYYKGKPVVVVSKNAVSIRDRIPLIIPYSCLKGEGALLGFEEKLKMNVNDKQVEVNCIIAISDKDSFSGFEALVHPELVRECV